MKITEITENEIKFDDGTVVSYYHDQSCCEKVYADFMAVEEGIKSHDFKKLSIVGVEDSGFRLNGYFVPCYNRQNGYYGSDLKLVITKPNGDTIEKDISEFVEDDTY